MSRETIFKDGAWVSGYEYTDERTLQNDIAQTERDLNFLKTRLAVMTGMANPEDVAEELHESFEELWEDIQDEMLSLMSMYVIDNNKEYINLK